MAAETLARFGGNRDDALTHHDQRRRRRRDGRRRRRARRRARCAELGATTLRARSTRCCRRPGRTPTRSTSSATRRSSATPTTLQALLADRGSGAVLFMHAPTAIVRSDDIARACAPLVRARRRPRDGVLARRRAPSPRRAASSTRPASPTTRRPRRRCAPSPCSPPTGATRRCCSRRRPPARTRPPDSRGARAIVDAALADGRDDARRGRGQGAAEGLRHPGRRRRVAVGASAPTPRRQRRASIGYPVALKILSPDISHKSDVGGVALDLRDDGRGARRRRRGCWRASRTLRPAGAASTASPCSRWCAGRSRRS